MGLAITILFPVESYFERQSGESRFGQGERALSPMNSFPKYLIRRFPEKSCIGKLQLKCHWELGDL